jgi:hypothetical protein
MYNTNSSLKAIVSLVYTSGRLKEVHLRESLVEMYLYHYYNNFNQGEHFGLTKTDNENAFYERSRLI